MGGKESGLYSVVDFSVSGLEQSVCAAAVSVLKVGVKMEQAFAMLSLRLQYLVQTLLYTNRLRVQRPNCLTIWDKHSFIL